MVSIFVTMPISGALFHLNPIAASFIYATQIPILHILLKEWYKSKDTGQG